MGCGLQCLKYLMFIFNFLFFLCGGVLMGLGIWILVDGASFEAIVADSVIIYNSVYIIIAVGGALLLISFFGCCGAIKESKCLLGTFFAIVLIIFILEIVGAALAFAYYPEAEQALVDSIGKYNSTARSEPITYSWDTVQSVFQCCGYNSTADWAANPLSTFSTVNGELVPKSCCTRLVPKIYGTIINETNCVFLVSDYHTKGCKDQFQSYFWLIGGIGFAVLVVQILAMVFACCLYCATGKDNYE